MKIINKLLILLSLALTVKASDFKDCFQAEAWQIDEKVNSWIEQNKAELLKLSILGARVADRENLLTRVQNNDSHLQNPFELSLNDLVKIPFKSNSKITCSAKTEGRIFFGRENGKLCFIDIISNSVVEEDEAPLNYNKQYKPNSAFRKVVSQKTKAESGIRDLFMEPNGFYGYSYHENGDVKEIKVIDNKITKKTILNLTKKLNGQFVKNIFQVQDCLFVVTKEALYRYDFKLNEFVESLPFNLGDSSEFLGFYFDDLTRTHNVALYNKSEYKIENFSYYFDFKPKLKVSFAILQTDVISFIKFYREIDSFKILIKVKNKLEGMHKIILGDLNSAVPTEIEFKDSDIQQEELDYSDCQKENDAIVDLLFSQDNEDIIIDMSLIGETIFMSDKKGQIYMIDFAGEELLFKSDDKYEYGSISQVFPLAQDVVFGVSKGNVFLRNFAKTEFALQLKVNKYAYLQMLAQELEKQRAADAQIAALPVARVLSL